MNMGQPVELPQITADLNEKTPTSAGVRTVQRIIIDVGFQSRIVLSCTVAREDCTTQSFTSGPANTAIFSQLITGNTVPGLTSVVYNCIGRMDVYGVGGQPNKYIMSYMPTGDCSSSVWFWACAVGEIRDPHKSTGSDR